MVFSLFGVYVNQLAELGVMSYRWRWSGLYEGLPRAL
jgi:hypothetical protein